MKRMLSWILLLASSVIVLGSASAQDNKSSTAQPGVVVGRQYTQDEISRARQLLAGIEPKKLQLKIGEHEIIEPSKDSKPLQFQYLTSNCFHLYEIKPGETLVIVGTRRGEMERRMYRYEARPYRWGLVEAKAKGEEVVVINRNGAAPDKDPPEEVDRILIVAGGELPPGPGPVPPGPTPPGPTPPGPAPIPQQGLRLMLVFDSKEFSGMTQKQINAINSREVREFLNNKCVKVNGWPEWRCWPKTADLSRDSETWKLAMERWRKAGEKTPWLLISNGKAGYEGDMPEDAEKLLELVRKYAE